MAGSLSNGADRKHTLFWMLFIALRGMECGDLCAMTLPAELPLPEETQKRIHLFGID